MKRFVQLFGMLMLLVAAVACEGPIGPMGPMGPQGPQGPQGAAGEGCNWAVFNLQAKASNWQYNYSDDGGYFSCGFDVDDLTDFIFEEGLVLCYADYGDAQAPLPTVRHNTNQNGDLWTTTIDYEYGPGFVDVYYTVNDFYYDDLGNGPGDMNFRLVLMW